MERPGLLRRRDRELVTKDATIREIHHRVKNNLQTVAALLRLQARRIEAPEAKAALEEAVRRVGSIAIVHETLSQAVEEHVDVDEVADRLGRMVTDVGAVGDVRVVRDGSIGTLGSEQATALAMVLTEVLQNAVEHGFVGRERGTVQIAAERSGTHLRAVVADDGVGMGHDPGSPKGALSGLGTQIVGTLVRNELRGTIDWAPREGGGRDPSEGVDLGLQVAQRRDDLGGLLVVGEHGAVDDHDRAAGQEGRQLGQRQRAVTVELLDAGRLVERVERARVGGVVAHDGLARRELHGGRAWSGSIRVSVWVLVGRMGQGRNGATYVVAAN